MRNNLAEFVMRGRKQAILTALLFTFIPFLGWVGDVIVALVTLRKGPKEGALVLLWVVLPGVVIASLGYSQLWFYDVIGGSVVTYGLAVILRSSGWSMVLQCGAVLALIGVFAAHIWTPTLAHDWFSEITLYLNATNQQFNLGIEPNTLQQLAIQLTKIATGMQFGLLLLADLFNLLVARWWQARLYNPEGLKIELCAVRLGFFPVCILVLILLGSFAGMAVAVDSLPVVLLPFILAGLSLLHGLLAITKVSKLWLIGFYGLLVLFFPYLGALLVIAALADCCWDLRRRIELYKLS